MYLIWVLRYQTMQCTVYLFVQGHEMFSYSSAGKKILLLLLYQKNVFGLNNTILCVLHLILSSRVYKMVFKQKFVIFPYARRLNHCSYSYHKSARNQIWTSKSLLGSNYWTNVLCAAQSVYTFKIVCQTWITSKLCFHAFSQTVSWNR